MIVADFSIAVNCEWTDWGEWSTCTKSCDGGFRERHRNISQEALNGGNSCQGAASAFSGCNDGPCPAGGDKKHKSILHIALNLEFDFNASHSSKLLLVPMDPMGNLLIIMWSWDTIAVKIL